MEQLDNCKVCGAEFKRHYRRGGIRQVYCSKKCKYADAYEDRTCKTCGAVFRANAFSNRGEYCSLACTERSPCQICGDIITGRRLFQSGERRFCSRKCASIANQTLRAEKNYSVIGFAATIVRRGSLICEWCEISDRDVLVVHHADHDHNNNDPGNLITLCANCHVRHHRVGSSKRAKDIELATFIASACPERVH